MFIPIFAINFLFIFCYNEKVNLRASIHPLKIFRRKFLYGKETRSP